MRTSPLRAAVASAALVLAGCGASPGATVPASSTTVAPGPLASSGLTPATSSGAAAASPSATPSAARSTVPPSTPSASRDDPLAVQRVRPCRAADVTTQVQRDGATGTALLTVRIVARPGARCRLGGYPRVTVVARGWTVRTVRTTVWDAGSDPAPFVVRPGHDGSVTFGWMRLTWCPPGMAVDRLDLRMPGGGTLRVQGFGQPGCDLGPKAGAVVDRPVEVGRFLPAA